MKRIRFFWVMIFGFLLITLSACGGGGGSASVQTNSAVIPTTTKVLDSNSSNAISAVSPDGSQITFTGTTPAIASLAIGDIIIGDVSSSAPSGLLKKVTGINQSGNQVVVNTTNATIEEAIQQGSFSVTSALDSNQAIQAVSVAQGVRLNQSTSVGQFNISINNVVIADQVIANGSITIAPSYTFTFKIDNFKLKNLTFSDTTSVTANITLSSNASLVDFNKSIEIFKRTFAPQTYYIEVGLPLPLPIVITPVLTVNVGLIGNISVGLSTGVTQQADATYGLNYDSVNGWSTIKNQSQSFTFIPPTVTAAATAKCYAGPKIELLLYGSVGPYASADGYLEFDANPLSNPWWQLYGGIESSAGVELEILSKLVASYNVNIFDERVLIAQADGGVTPPVPLPFSISGTVSGATLSGVTITVTGTATATATTDAGGNYSATGLYDGNYTVTPSKTGYTFSPSSTAVTMSGANITGKSFEATANPAPTYTISGSVSGDVQSGVTIVLSGGTSVTTTTNTSGNYSFSGHVDVSYTVTPSLTGYTFSPVNSVANVSGADVTGKNFVATAIPINVSGTWTGTGYSPETGTSPTAVIFSQSGNSVSGTWDGDAVTGTVSGNQLTLTVTPFTQNGWSLTGNISATVTGNSMSGTLSMTGRSGSTSTTANGTFTVTRSGSVAVTLYNAYDAPAGGFIAAIVGAIAE